MASFFRYATLDEENSVSHSGIDIMTRNEWEAVERTLAGLSVDDKRDVADRILRSIQAVVPAADRARRQRDAMNRLCMTVDAMPSPEHGDGLSNRDHDRLIYSR